MTRIVKWIAGGILLLAAMAGGWWLESYRWAGGFRTVAPHFNGACTPVSGVPGPEDLQIDRSTRVAYVSSYDRAAVRRGQNVRGAILAYDLARAGATPVNVTPESPADFRPHGISLVADHGKQRLFVINHAPDGERIEIFDLAAGRLAHARTVKGPALVSPNDIVAVALDRFYVTNSRRHSQGTLAWIESTFRLDWGNVVYFDGARFTEVLNRIGFPNGINRDKDGRHVYVVSSFDQAVHVYARDTGTDAVGTLTRAGTLRVGTRLDNVDVSENGDLWVAGRAQYLEAPQPSQVVRIAADGRVDEVYVSRGDQFGNASVAAADGRDLLIGSSGGNQFIHCVMGG